MRDRLPNDAMYLVRQHFARMAICLLCGRFTHVMLFVLCVPSGAFARCLVYSHGNVRYFVLNTCPAHMAREYDNQRVPDYCYDYDYVHGL